LAPNKLRAVRQEWIDKGLAITTINSYTGNVKLIFFGRNRRMSPLVFSLIPRW